jgi:hypothetical protein
MVDDEDSRTAEFRTMLEGLDLTCPLAQWKGHYFYAQVGIMENQEFDVNFCACDNGISFVFPMEHWKSIQNLFRRALAVARRDAGVGNHSCIQ